MVVFLALLILARSRYRNTNWANEKHSREVELLNIRSRRGDDSPPRRSSSRPSKSHRKSPGLLTGANQAEKEHFQDAQQMSSDTLMCQEGSTYCLDNPRKRLISRDCAIPSICAINLIPPDRNYALKDEGGDPQQTDLRRNCKREYVI